MIDYDNTQFDEKKGVKPSYRSIPICDPASIGRGAASADCPGLRGYNTHRLRRDDPYHHDEVRLSDELSYLNESNCNAVTQIIFGGATEGVVLDVHEERLIATVIQWLGTPVGKAFLQRCGFVHEESHERESTIQRTEIYQAILRNKNIVADIAALKKIFKIE